MRRVWDGDDAFLPIDPDLPAAAQRRIVESMRPSAFVEAHGELVKLSGGEPVEAGDAIVVATSGTTGEPKGVVLTHEAVATSAELTSRRLGVEPARDRWLACLKLAHVGGLSVVTRALHTGIPLELLPRYDTSEVVAAAGRGATLVSLVPTTLQRLGPARVGLFRRILLGGAAPPDTVPENVVTTYGLTETGSGVVYDGVPLDGVDVAISASGEVLVRSPTALRCYRDGTVPFLDGGWLPTGDGGSLDDAGVLTVFGRQTEMIISGGENVWPAAVEAVLRRSPLVGEVAVAGRPDPEWGERVVAFVVPAARARGADTAASPRLEELRELVKADIGRHAAPRELVIVDQLPRTASGKVRRSALGADGGRVVGSRQCQE
jgi:o-succinylbenzoate---CoA ligase